MKHSQKSETEYFSLEVNVLHKTIKKTLGFFIKYFLYFIYFFIKTFFKNKKKYILVGTCNPSFSDNAKYFFIRLSNHKTYNKNSYFVINSYQLYKKLSKDYKVIYKWHISTLVKVLNAKIFIYTHEYTDIYKYIPEDTIAINLWHGTPIKPIAYDSKVDLIKMSIDSEKGILPKFKRTDFFCIASKNCQFIFETAMGYEKDKLIITGLPRNDILYEKKDDFSYISALKKTLYGHDKKVILYAPTFREVDRLNIQIELNKLSKFFESINNILVCIRMHPRERDLLGKDFFDGEHVIDGSYFDMQELLLSADILISDYSSLIFDYAVLERPIVLYAYDIDVYQESRGKFYFEYKQLFKNFAICSNIDELKRAVVKSESFIDYELSTRFNTYGASTNVISFVNTL